MNKIMDCYDPYFKIRIINFRIIIMESYTNTNCKEIQMMFVQKVFNMLAIIGSAESDQPWAVSLC